MKTGGATELVVVVMYLAAMIVVGIIIARRIKGSDDYLAGGRNKPFWLVTATLFATWWCGGVVLGASGAAYHDGFMGAIYDPYGAGLTMILAGFLTMKIVHDAKVNSLGQFYSLRYGPWASKFSGIVIVPAYTAFVTGQLVAIGKVLQSLMGWNYGVSILVGTLIILSYTILGGILAVAWTDIIQIVLLLIGIIILFPAVINLAGGWEAVTAAAPATHFALFPTAAVRELGFGWLWWLGAFLGVGLGTMAGPDLYQRAIIAKDGKTAMKASVTAGVGYWVLGALPVIIGIAGISLVQSGVIDPALIEEDSEMLVLMLASKVFPPILNGIFLASLVAAIMSTADSGIFATAAVLANDIIKPFYEKAGTKTMTDKQLIFATRVSIVGIAALGLVIGLGLPNIYTFLIIGFQLLFHSLFFPLILGIYWKKANATGAVAGMIVGVTIPIVWLLIGGFDGIYVINGVDVEWIWALGPGVVSGLVMVIVSLATQTSNPPQPLYNSEGKVLKFPELAAK
jgi:solute:Na+ symporter, SSS family